MERSLSSVLLFSYFKKTEQPKYSALSVLTQALFVFAMIRWTVPSYPLMLPPQTVHIWQAALNLSESALSCLAQTLSLDERSRADRFQFSVHRQRFIAARGILREILGQYLNIPPGQVHFHYEHRGKPMLSPICSEQPVQFNVSHSQDLMLCAVTPSHCLGIDLEYIRDVSDLERLTQRFFSPSEHAAIHAQLPPQRSHAFFQYWTCKEAVLKAIGTGLVNLESVEIQVTDEAVTLVRWDTNPQSIKNWWLYSFTPAPDFIAALAVDGLSQEPLPQARDTLVFFRWEFNSRVDVKSECVNQE